MGQRIKKDDLVVVIAGKDKGTQGRVLKTFPETGRVLVEGVNRVKRHQKPTPQFQQGGIIEKEAPIHASNVMPVDTKTDSPTRVRVGEDKDGKKVRISVKSGTVLGS
jgi:large subunit ribosomal protein L24